MNNYWHEFQKKLDIARIRSKARYCFALSRMIIDRNTPSSKNKLPLKTIIFNIAFQILITNKFFPVLRNIISKTRKKRCIEKFEKALGMNSDKFVFMHHHIAHNFAALYFIDDSKTHLMFSMDGYGDDLSSSVGIWNGNDYQVISSSGDDVSFGHLYSSVTGFLGMKAGEHEFKVMGMAPYAYSKDVNRIKKFFEKYLFMDETGKFKVNRKIKDLNIWLLGNLSYERFDNIAGAIQLFAEELIVNWINYWIEKTGITSVTLGGGVFMNVKAAKRVYEIPEVTELFVIPSSGDESLAIGGLYYGNSILNQKTKKIKNLYLGREFSDEYIKNYLGTVSERYEYEFLAEDDTAVRVARLLADNKIVARCAGREEWGAREEIPAAIHPKDYTVRPQAVVKEWNPGYYKIIAEFKKLTGCGAILNTSFNLHGEPNVGSPEDAIHTLDNSKLEYVILGSFLVHKK